MNSTQRINRLGDNPKLQDVQCALENELYLVLIKFFEGYEHRRLVDGNGHHMAQTCLRFCCKLLAERWLGEGKNKYADCEV